MLKEELPLNLSNQVLDKSLKESMEFPFDINQLLPDDITVIDSKLHPFTSHHIKEKCAYVLNKNLELVIDKMGAASSKAQNLKNTITSYGKLSVNDHRLYLLKDGSANSGRGAVIGLIKVGKKRLFLVDIHNQQLEVNPLCVLDFYVHEQQQRSGYGHRLFNFMLERECVKPQFLAYDRPSIKFINFLRKHFDLQNAISQMNKFVVFDLFFRDLSAVGYIPRNRRFVSSAPSDSRMHSLTGSRSLPSASSFSRARSGTINELRIRDRSSTHYESTLASCNYSSSPLAALPPKSPGKTSSAHAREVTWSRRNASHMLFASDFSSNTKEAKSNDHKKSLYSRHSYTDASKARQPVSQIQSSGAKQSTSDSSLGLRGMNEEMKSRAQLNVNKPVEEKKDIPVRGNEKSTYSQNNSDQSYSVDKLHQQRLRNRNSPYGTSWNLFGVPSNVNNSNINTTNNQYKRNQTGYFY